MHPEVVTAESSGLVKDLVAAGVTEGFYLAGGTGLALRLGHRMSEDLDFFTDTEFPVDGLLGALSSIDRLRVDKQDSGSLVGLLRGVRISFLSYAYRLVNEVWMWSGLRIADPVDIACMKLIAVADRGLRRDFVDMCFLLREVIDLDGLFAAMGAKYAAIEYNKMHLLKGLTFFGDAEADPLPKMLVPFEWDEAKAEIVAAVESWMRRAAEGLPLRSEHDSIGRGKVGFEGNLRLHD